MRKVSKKKRLAFADKLVLNQFLISLFGIDPLVDGYKRGEKPFHKLAATLRVTREGLDSDGLHHFYHKLKDGDFFRTMSRHTVKRLNADIIPHPSQVQCRFPAKRESRGRCSAE